MTRLESTKNINAIKSYATRNGGYKKHLAAITEACAIHKSSFGDDYFPKHLK